MQYIDKQGQKSNIHSYIKHAQDFARGVYYTWKSFFRNIFNNKISFQGKDQSSTSNSSILHVEQTKYKSHGGIKNMPEKQYTKLNGFLPIQ